MTRGLAALWYIGGCLSGAAIASTGFLLVPLLWQQPEPAPAPPPAKEPEVQAKPCATFAELSVPWQPEKEAASDNRPKPPPSPKSIAKRVDFWRKLWGEHNNRLYLLVDHRHPWLVHSMVDCQALFRSNSSSKKAHQLCDKRLIAAKRKVVKRLKKSKRKPQKSLLRKLGNDKKLAKTAYRSVLVLEGHRDSLQQAKARIEPYMSHLEQIFSAQDLPPELARLAIIESLFDPSAVSKAGAVGAYQFVAGTAKVYLQVDEHIDERLDPLREGWAAARYLKAMNQEFRSWPLTLTAYNTGPTRLRKISKKHRTRDIGTIIEKARSGRFGFDGQNYYAQFLAVVDLTQELTTTQPIAKNRVVAMPLELPLAEVSRCVDVPEQAIIDANPAFTEVFRQGDATIPKAYKLALPRIAPNQAKES